MFSSALISLFVSGVMRKPHNRFSQNSVETWHMDGRNKQILVIIRITLHQVELQQDQGYG